MHPRTEYFWIARHLPGYSFKYVISYSRNPHYQGCVCDTEFPKLKPTGIYLPERWFFINVMCCSTVPKVQAVVRRIDNLGEHAVSTAKTNEIS